VALKLRPTGLGSGIDKDRPDYTVYCGSWNVGRIYETRRSRQSALVLVVHLHWSDGRGEREMATCIGIIRYADARFSMSWPIRSVGSDFSDLEAPAWTIRRWHPLEIDCW